MNNLKKYINLWEINDYSVSSFTRKEKQEFSSILAQYYILDEIWCNIGIETHIDEVISCDIKPWKLTRTNPVPDNGNIIMIANNSGINGIYYNDFNEVIIAPNLFKVIKKENNISLVEILKK